MTTGEQLQVMKLCARRYHRMMERRRAKGKGDVNLELNFSQPQSPQSDLL
jgi:hypothetical protein